MAASARLSESDPEGALLVRLYRKLDLRPVAHFRENMPEAARADLAALHRAVADCRPLRLAMRTLPTTRPGAGCRHWRWSTRRRGDKLPAWCDKARDFRQSFVRAMQDPTPQPGDFRLDRMALLQGLAEKKAPSRFLRFPNTLG